MYCSNCKGTVQMTTKVCPHCGGDMTKLFGPIKKWGKSPKDPEVIEKKKQQAVRIKELQDLKEQERANNNGHPSTTDIVIQCICGCIGMALFLWLVS